MTLHDARFAPFAGAHPLVRLALSDQGLRLTHAHVFSELRKLIDPVRRNALSEGQQDEAAASVLNRLPQLGLSPDDEMLLRRDVLRLLMQLTPRPKLLMDLFVCELDHCQLLLEPSYWCQGGNPSTESSLPHLADAQWPVKLSTALYLPAICSEAATVAIRLAHEGANNRSICAWPVGDCEIALRLLVMNTLLGAPSGDEPAKAAKARHDAFNDEGLPLWNRLLLLADWRADPGATPWIWERDLRVRIKQLLRQRWDEARSGRTLPPPGKGYTASSSQVVERADAKGRRGDQTAEALLDSRAGRPRSDQANPASSGRLVVITTPIAPASYKEDQQALAPYEALRKPVPVAAMPTASDLQALLDAQEAEFPWAKAPLRLLRERLITASLLGVRELHLPPVLLVGTPGCGKSRFIRRLAKRLQLAYMSMALAGAHDTKLLSGTSRGWASASASPLVRLLLQHRSASAFVLLDEMDKLGHNGEATSPVANQLLGLLEPETARRWHDGFLQADCDFGRIIFWGTANSLEGVSKPLLSRMELVVMRGPEREHLPGVAASIAADLEQEWQLPPGTLPQVPKSVWALGADNLRTLRSALMKYLHEWVQRERVPQRLH